MQEQYVYQLKSLLEYTKKGEFVETGSIIFDPPNMSVNDEVTDFEQILMGSIISVSKNGLHKNDESEEVDRSEPMKAPTATEIRMLLFSSQDIRVNDVFKSFKRLAMKTAKLDDETKIYETSFDKMDRSDFIDMLCGYASFFTFPSLLRGE